MEEHQSDWPIAVMCDVLKVSRSGFYSWRRRQESPVVLTPTAKKRRERFAAIEEVFQKSRGSNCLFPHYDNFVSCGLAMLNSEVASC
jgi:hypothetical protein